MTAKTNTGSKLAGSLRRAKNQTTDATETAATQPVAKPAVAKKEESAPAPVKRFARRVWPD